MEHGKCPISSAVETIVRDQTWGRRLPLVGPAMVLRPTVFSGSEITLLAICWISTREEYMATTSAVDDRTETVSVLVVDDDHAAGRFVAESLELADAAVSARAETDPEAALDAVREGGVDCVVTEIALNGIDGYEFLDQVAALDESVRAVVHTNDDDPAVASEAWNRGAAYARKGSDLDRYDVLARHITGDVDAA